MMLWWLPCLTAAVMAAPPPVRVCMMFRDVTPTAQTFTHTLGAKFFLSAMLAVQHANERDGSVVPQLASELEPGQRVEFQLQPTSGNPTGGIQGFLECVKPGSEADVIVGPARSSVSIAVARVAQHWRMTTVSHWSTSSKLSDKAQFPYFARAVPSDRDVAAAAVHLLQGPTGRGGLGFKTVHFIYPSNDAFGVSYYTDYRAEFERAFKGQGFKLVALPFHDPFSDSPAVLKGALASVMRVLAHEPSSVAFCPVADWHVEHLLAEAESHGLLGNGRVWVGADTWLANTRGTHTALAQVRRRMHGSMRVLARGVLGASLRALQASWTPKLRALSASLPARNSTFEAAGPQLALPPELLAAPLAGPDADQIGFTFDAATAAILSVLKSRKALGAGATPNQQRDGVRAALANLTFNGATGAFSVTKDLDRATSTIVLSVESFYALACNDTLVGCASKAGMCGDGGFMQTGEIKASKAVDGSKSYAVHRAPGTQLRFCTNTTEHSVLSVLNDGSSGRDGAFAYAVVLGAIIVAALLRLVLLACWRRYQRSKQQVMISYRHTDVKIALQLERELRRWGFRPWIDTAIAPGNDWRQDIAVAIQDSVAVVFIMSPGSVTSKYCKEELFYASALKKPIFPIVHQECFSDLKGGVKTILQRVQWIQFADFSEGSATLRQQLRRINTPAGEARSPKVSPARLSAPVIAKLHSGAAIARAAAAADTDSAAAAATAADAAAASEPSDIYICFDHSDAELAQRLHDIFAARGLRSTLARQRPEMGDAALGPVEVVDLNSRAAADATVFCFVLSQVSMTSDTCGEEFHAAYELDKPMMAVTDAEVGGVPALLAERGSMAMMLESSTASGDTIAFGKVPRQHAEFATTAVAFKLLAAANSGYRYKSKKHAGPSLKIKKQSKLDGHSNSSLRRTNSSGDGIGGSFKHLRLNRKSVE